MTNITELLRAGLETGFLFKDHLSDEDYQPQLLLNDCSTRTKVLSTLLRELQHCQSFVFSVAFLTTSGVAVLYSELEALAEKNICGQILVSQYQNFTHPIALKRLMLLPNVSLYIATKGNFHAKSYLFHHQKYDSLIVGSSNLTSNALTTNKEWNLKITALKGSKVIDEALRAFHAEREAATVVDEAYIASYQAVFDAQRRVIKPQEKFIENLTSKAIAPNRMQQEALQNLEKLRLEGKTKALLISATGTGKTYLSAFDVQAFQPKRLLFLVHRRTIANKAMESYLRIFPEGKTMGLLSGEHRDVEKDFVFSTIQTISRPSTLTSFDPQQFDYIVIDESHRVGGETYQRILDHFKPRFLLGMTATPERTDGFDIFRQFDYNIAHEIRLQRALEEEMLSPFHYYGVTDIFAEDQQLDSESFFLRLKASERVNHILEKSQKYGCDDGEIRCLVFCSTNHIAATLAQAFVEKGQRAIALSGESSESEREAAIERLESDDPQQKLTYLFTVDIFNEGVDIPRLNQIIMLRPTQSAIVFVQQLGRGLRKTEGKEYLTVIDFIGNYQNNYLVPIALYGDQSYNKDTLRKLLANECDAIHGASTVHFERIAKERIFAAIDQARMTLKKDLVQDYALLKYKLGRVPTMMDFLDHGSRDPYLYVEAERSYYTFVESQEPDFAQQYNLTSTHRHLIELFSREICNGKRVEEALLLKHLVDSSSITLSDFREMVHKCYGYQPSEATLLSIVNNINFGFVTENTIKEESNSKSKRVKVSHKYDYQLLHLHDGKEYTSTEFWRKQLESKGFVRVLLDVIEFGIARFSKGFDLRMWVDGFVLYQKYSRKDVFRILNWEENPVPQNVGGYMLHPQRKDCAAFVNYHKDDGIAATIQYEDAFTDRCHFEWLSKSKRSVTSPDVIAIIDHKALGMRIPLFVKKHNDEGQDFYYMGDMTYLSDSARSVQMADGRTMAVRMGFKLSHPVELGLFRYITERHR